MECNKDEALRAKEIAVRKFTERDYSSARKFALKAQNLFPGLEGLSQMMTTVDVYISAENKINGEIDWYGILGVNQLVDDETIRKHYRKLALTLHPDKNKSLGAEGAFKLVSEAWSLLSDKEKRLAYNQMRDSSRYQQKAPKQNQNPSEPTSSNGFQNFGSNLNAKAWAPQRNHRVGMTSSHSSSRRKPDTFWTLCNRCKTHYEYLRIYLNHTLLCPNCHEAFLALEKAPPPNVVKSSNLPPRDHRQNSGIARNSEPGGPARLSSSFNNKHFQFGPSASEKAKRERDEAQSASDWERKKQRMDDDTTNKQGVQMVNRMVMGDCCGSGGLSESRKGTLETQRIYGYYGAYYKSNTQRELSILESRHMLMNKARSEICKKLKEWRLSPKIQKSVVNGDTRDSKRNSKSSVIKGHQNKKSLSGATDTDKENKPTSINVPDSDFHNFDLDRSETSFGEDQVWAAYDDDDGMPRYYARIHKVISKKPFRMRISWLNSRSNSEFGPLDWVGMGFAKTCGEFRIGRHESASKLNSFSHKVQWRKGLRGVIHIFPQKGEIWALYRNWSSDWNEHTPNEVVHKYDMVEVVDDFDEDQGVSVAPLVKVSGFRTVFRRHVDPKEVKKIPKEEMFRFSHQVPSYLLTGHEAPNAPKGCRELDPAATPLDLLQTITETVVTPMEKNGEVREVMLKNVAEANVNPLVNDAEDGEVDVVRDGEEQIGDGR